MHRLYGLKHWLGKILWVLAALTLVMAWVASFRANGTLLNLPVAHLFWDALILGVLAIGLKSGGHGCCGGDNCACGSDEK